MEPPTTPLQHRLAALHQRVQDNRHRRLTERGNEVARLLARHDQALAAKVDHARSVIRHGDFSDHGYLVTNGLVSY